MLRARTPRGRSPRHHRRRDPGPPPHLAALGALPLAASRGRPPGPPGWCEGQWAGCRNRPADRTSPAWPYPPTPRPCPGHAQCQEVACGVIQGARVRRGQGQPLAQPCPVELSAVMGMSCMCAAPYEATEHTRCSECALEEFFLFHSFFMNLNLNSYMWLMV